MFKIFAVPLSMDELLGCLDRCTSAEELREKIALPTWRQGSLSQQRFCEVIRYPFESYTDLTFAKWGTFLKKVKVLFPRANAADAKALESFQAFAQKRMVALSPSLSAALTTDPGRKLSFVHADVSHGYQKDRIHFSTSEALRLLETHFPLSHAERLNEALAKEDCSSSEKRASRLQIILTLLLFEVNLMKYTRDFVKAAYKMQELQAKLREGSALIVRLSPYDEVTLFEIPLKIDNSDEFALWLNLSPYFSLRKKGERHFACFVPLEEGNINQLLMKLRQFQTVNENAKIQAIVEKLLSWLDVQLEFQSMLDESQRLDSYLVKVQRSLLVKEKYAPSLEKTVTPGSYILGSLLRNHFAAWRKDKVRDLPVDHLNDLRQTISFGETHRSQQRTLFAFIKKELDGHISPFRGQTKITFLKKYTRNLIGEGNQEGEVITTYPSEEAILGLPSSIPEPESPLPPKTIKPKEPQKKKREQEKKEEKVRQEGRFPQRAPADPVKTDIEIEEKEFSPETPSPSPVPFRSLGETFPYPFDERVERWRRHTFGEPLPPEDFPEYQDMSLSHQVLMHVFHHPHDVVDRFLSMAIQGSWPTALKKQENLRFVIPCEIIFRSKTYRGFMSYAVDRETHLCYHCCFTERVDADILSDVIFQTFKENDFPELALAVSTLRAPKQTPTSIADAKVIEDAIFGNVTIHVRSKDLTIKLFKTTSTELAR